jgi:hypothetical protein
MKKAENAGHFDAIVIKLTYGDLHQSIKSLHYKHLSNYTDKPRNQIEPAYSNAKYRPKAIRNARAEARAST